MSEPTNAGEGESSRSRPDENTPLLADSNGEETTSIVQTEREAHVAELGNSNARSTLTAWMLRFMALSWTIALMIDALAIAIYIMILNEPAPFSTPYRIWSSLPVVAALAVVAGLSSSFNAVKIRRLPPNTLSSAGFITILLDAFLAIYLGSATAETADELPGWSSSSRCDNYYRPVDPPAKEQCMRFADILRVVLSVYAVLLLLLFLVHAVLFILRFLSVYRSRAERGTHISRWRIPSWDFTIEFTIKYRNLDQENGVTTGEITPAPRDA